MKLRIFVIGLITTMFLAGCSNLGFQAQVLPPPQATPTTQMVEQPVITATPPSPTATVVSSPTAFTLSGATGILFSSKRGGDYQDLYIQEFGSEKITRLTQGDSSTFPGPFSPNGQQIVFTGFGLTNSYIGVMNADGSDPVNLTNLPDVSDGFPAWSPDGSQIAFTSRRDGNNEIYVMDLYGYQLKQLTFNPTDDFAPSWSPDGNQIAFLSDRDNSTGIYSIYIMNIDGSDARQLTPTGGNSQGPSFSPDGEWVAFTAYFDKYGDDHGCEIYIIRVDGTDLRRLTNNDYCDYQPRWGP